MVSVISLWRNIIYGNREPALWSRKSILRSTTMLFFRTIDVPCLCRRHTSSCKIKPNFICRRLMKIERCHRASKKQNNGPRPIFWRITKCKDKSSLENRNIRIHWLRETCTLQVSLIRFFGLLCLQKLFEDELRSFQ